MKNPRVIATVVGLTVILLVAASAFVRLDSRTEDTLLSFLPSQAKVREEMVLGLRTHDRDAFCDAYLEFKRIAKEEPLIFEGAQPVKGGKDYWTVLLLVSDAQLIRTFVDLNGLCEAYCPY